MNLTILQKNIVCFLIFLFPLGVVLAQPSGYNLVYEEQFDDNVVTWAIDNCVTHGAEQCEEAMFYMDDNVREFGGRLIIEARIESVTCGEKLKPFTSGQAISPFSFAYGYFEIRAKLPTGNGMWPAFWFWSGCNSQEYSEIDVFEFCGCDCSTFDAGTWYEIDSDEINEGPNGSVHAVQEIDFDGNGCDDFHTYALEWTPTVLGFYVDGNLKFTKPNINNRDPMPVILNLAINGCGGGCSGWHWCDDEPNYQPYGPCRIDCDFTPADWPKTYEIDHLKIWKKTNQAVSLIAPDNLCINQTEDAFVTHIPGATYAWTSTSGLTVNPIPGEDWSCEPQEVKRKALITATAGGTQTLSVTVTFPSGYTETHTKQIIVSTAPPTTPTSVSFLFNQANCCYYANVVGGTGATSYTWRVGNNNYTITTEDRLLDEFCFTPGRPAVVRVTAVNACGESSTYFISTTLPTPWAPPCGKNMSITPNPSTGLITVTIDSGEFEFVPGTFRVFDLYGNLKAEEYLDYNEEIINISSLSGGIYLAYFLDGTNTIQNMLIKE